MNDFQNLLYSHGMTLQQRSKIRIILTQTNT
jgi:hypothetical protein